MGQEKRPGREFDGMAGTLKAIDEKGATLPVVVPNSWVTRLNDLARERGIARSALIRNAIELELLKDGQPGKKAVPVAMGE